jgi:hypothetical protein
MSAGIGALVDLTPASDATFTVYSIPPLIMVTLIVIFIH